MSVAQVVSQRTLKFEAECRRTVEHAVLTGVLTHSATVMRVLIGRAVSRGEIKIRRDDRDERFHSIRHRR